MALFKGGRRVLLRSSSTRKFLNGGRELTAAAAAFFLTCAAIAVRPARAFVLFVDDGKDHQRFGGRRRGLLLAGGHLNEAAHQIPRRVSAGFLNVVARVAFFPPPRARR